MAIKTVYEVTEHLLKATLYLAALAAVGLPDAEWHHNTNDTTTTLPPPLHVCQVVAAILLSVATLSELSFAICTRPKLPPGSLGVLPLVGEMPWYYTNPLEFLLAKKRQYGDIFMAHIVLAPTVCVFKEEDVQWLWKLERKGLVKRKWPSHWVRYLIGSKGSRNIIMSSGKDHNLFRRLLEPTFSPIGIRRHLNNLDSIIQQQLERYHDQTNYCGQKKYLSVAVFKLFALKLVYGTAFGSMDEEILLQLSHDMGIWIEGFMAFCPIPIPGNQLHTSIQARQRIMTTLETLVQGFQSKHTPDSEEGENSLLGRLCYGTDDTGKPLSKRDILENIHGILFAGHETVHGSFGSILYYMHSHQEAPHHKSKKQVPIADNALSHSHVCFCVLWCCH